MNAFLGHIGDGLQQCERHILTDDGGRLKEALVLGWQPVDTGGEDRLSRRRDLPCLGRLRQSIGPAIPDQRPGLHQGLHRLLEEEGVAFGPLDQHALEALEALVLAQERGEQLFSALERQRIDPELGVVGLARPGVLVLGTVVDDEQDARGRQAFDQGIEQRLALGVDPVEVGND